MEVTSEDTVPASPTLGKCRGGLGSYQLMKERCGREMKVLETNMLHYQDSTEQLWFHSYALNSLSCLRATKVGMLVHCTSLFNTVRVWEEFEKEKKKQETTQEILFEEFKPSLIFTKDQKTCWLQQMPKATILCCWPNPDEAVV